MSKATEIPAPMPRPHYPEPAGMDHMMTFRRGMCGFSLARADNGVVFQEYDISNDEIRRKVAVSPEQLQALFDAWHKERTGEVLKWAREFFAQIDVA